MNLKCSDRYRTVKTCAFRTVCRTTSSRCDTRVFGPPSHLNTSCVQCRCVRGRVMQSQSSPSKTTTPSLLSVRAGLATPAQSPPHQKQAASDLPAIASLSVPSSHDATGSGFPSCCGSCPCPSSNTYTAVTGGDFRRWLHLAQSTRGKGQYFPPHKQDIEGTSQEV